MLNEDSGSVARLEAKDFRGRYSDLPGVLEQVAGVTVHRTGGFGEHADVSIRGTSAKQVQVFLDGVPLNNASGGAVDLSKIPLNSLQKINIYKGAAPLKLMGAAAGGVINLITDPGKDIVSANVELGSFGYRTAGALLRKKTGRMSHRFLIDYQDAENDYTMPYNPTPLIPSNTIWIKKINNAYAAATVVYAPRPRVTSQEIQAIILPCPKRFMPRFSSTEA
jgi:iron complex outermembrane receptor protein